MRSVKIPYKRQGLIYFLGLNFDVQDETTKDKILKLCGEVGGVHSAALLEVVRRGAMGPEFSEVAKRHFMDEGALYKLRRRYYERF